MTDNYAKIVQNNLEKKPSGEYCSKNLLELIEQ